MKKIKIVLSVLCLLAFISVLPAQNVKYTVGDSSKMTISGTSTLHDWTSTVNEINGYVEVSDGLETNGKVENGAVVHAVHVIVPVKSIISPRGATMDKKTYAALKSDVNPEIIFDLKKSEVEESSGSTFTLRCKGDLTIAGKTNQVEFPVTGNVIAANTLGFSGSYKLNMKDYDMVPPSAMYGTIETGENVEINFELIVTK